MWHVRRWGSRIRWFTVAPDNGIMDTNSVSDGLQRRTTEESESFQAARDVVGLTHGCAENRFFEGTTCASEIRSALSTDEDEFTGDNSRQLADLENKKGCVVVDDGKPHWTWRP